MRRDFNTYRAYYSLSSREGSHFFRIVIYIMLLTASVELIAKEVRIGVGEFPPYVIKKGNTGIQLELIKEIFSGTGYTPVFQYLPNSRILKQFKRGKLDIAINVNQGLFKDKFYSDEVVSFNNYAISLKNNNFNIKSIKDLQKLSVLSFQNAKLILACMLHQLVT